MTNTPKVMIKLQELQEQVLKLPIKERWNYLYIISKMIIMSKLIKVNYCQI
ncbi:MAG: hypothetical protein HCA25_22970 [Dolichospermum sp. DET50]|nr:hypothetical protein [Dolichospermum sp. DET66]MBS3035034.1 hypothetical protein [Dolichospermum sp. DET67]MBS3040234.1 hypothetical protein [Dolichospermum sp. DET50]QSX70859.1 MAG: hypothetical protein EZY12_22245 [Dolichospermum sp. DET69]